MIRPLASFLPLCASFVRAWMKSILTVFLAFWACAAPAQDLWPALFDVTGVTSDDVLNVREAADAGSAIIGSLAHDQTDVEIAFASDDGQWGAINVGERSGWARLSFLQRHPGNWTDAQAVFGQCFGTEPFWSLSLIEPKGSHLLLDTPEGHSGWQLFDRQLSRNRNDRLSLAAGKATALGSLPTMYVSLRSEACSDGMSDRSYGLGVDILHWRDGFQSLSGCCTLGAPE